MKLTTILVLILLQTQSINLDSIYQKVKSAQSEKEHIEQIMVLGAALPHFESDSLLRLANILEEIEGSEKDFADAGALYLKGVYYYKMGRFPECIESMEQVIPVFNQLKAYQPLAKAYNWIALSYMRSREFPQALAIYEKVQQNEKLMTDKDLLTVMYGNMGILYRYVGDYEKAFHYFSLDLSLSPNDAHKLAITYMNIASMFNQLEMYEEALNTLLAIDTAALPIAPVKVAVFKDIGTSYEKLGKFDLAASWMEASIIEGKHIGEFHQLIRPLTFLVHYYVDKDQWTKAKQSLDTARLYAFKYGRGQEQIAYFRAEQTYYLATSEPDSSILSGIQQIPLATQFRVPHMLNNTYRDLSKAYELKGQLDSANFYLNEQNIWERQNAQANEMRVKADAIVKLRLSEMNKEMLAAKDKAESIKYYWIGIILLTFFMALLLWRYMKYRTENKASESLNAFLKTLSESQSERIEELETYIDNYRKLNNGTPEYVVLRNKLQLKVSNLVYGCSEGHYVLFYPLDSLEPIQERITLKEVLETLPASLFIQIHKSYFVNIAHIRELSSTHVRTTTNEYLPISRNFKSEVSKVFYK